MKDDERYLIVANLSDYPAQTRVQVEGLGASGGSLRLTDGLSAVTYERDGAEMRSPGLYVDLKPWSYHFLQVLNRS